LALLHHGNNEGQRDALSLVESEIKQATDLTCELVESYCSVALELREYQSIARVLGKASRQDTYYWMIKALWPALEDRTFVYFCGEPLVKAVRTASYYEGCKNGEKDKFNQVAERVEALLRNAKSG
jgi:hypothetical protein